MSQNILKDLPELLNSGIITQETADNIKSFYDKKKEASSNKLIVIFGILGALLIGLGIILIIAHNWDNLNRPLKTVFAFIPLITGQLLCAFALMKKNESVAWRESASTFLFFAIGAAISLISQIYNIPGRTSVFLLTWMLLSFPLIYLMRSSFVSLLYIIGISYYAGEVGFSFSTSFDYNYYWLLLLIVLPHYWMLYKSGKHTNFFTFHSWFIAISLLIGLGTYSKAYEQFMMISYFSLLGLFYLLGNTDFFNKQKIINNSYLLLGGFGTLVMLLVLSFDFFWESLIKTDFFFNEVLVSPDFITALITSITALILFIYNKKKYSFSTFDFNEIIFILFIIIFFLGFEFTIFPIIMINLILFTSGLYYIWRGVKSNHLLLMNYGLIIIAALITCRFFDTNLSFVLRGILFVGLGLAFFFTNYLMLKRKNEHNSTDESTPVIKN